MTAREIIDYVCGRVRVNFNDAETDVVYSMVGDASGICCAKQADFFLGLEVVSISPTDYELAIFCDSPSEGDPS